MKTNKYLVVGLLAGMALVSCSNDEETYVEAGTADITLSAGINRATRAVIDADYGNDLPVSFIRIDNPASGAASWQSSVDAVRAGGSGNTAITFTNTQTYLTLDVASYMVGFYPRPAVATATGNPVNVSYTITGDEDVMATAIQSGSSGTPFTPFTFNHLLTQLQFQCIGSSDAHDLWTEITSINVQQVPSVLTLAIDKTQLNLVPVLTAAATPLADLSVFNCPDTLATAASTAKKIGYTMLYPTAGLGTAADPVTLEVRGVYDGAPVARTVTVENIDGGALASHSHMLTLTFTVDGEINVEAGIAEWLPGNGGGTTVTPAD